MSLTTGSGLVTLLRDLRVLRLLPGSLFEGLCDLFFSPPLFFPPNSFRLTPRPDLRKFVPRALLLPLTSTEAVFLNSGGADLDTLVSPLDLFSDTTSNDQDLEVPLAALEVFRSSAEALFLSGVEVQDKTLSSLSLEMNEAFGSLSLQELVGEACDLLDV